LVRGLRSLPNIGYVCSSLLQHHTTCFGPPKVFLRANQDIFTCQLTTCLGPPKDPLWASQDIFAQHLLLYQRKYRIALSLPLGQPRLVLTLLRNSSPHVKDLVINPLGPTVMFSKVNMCILMVHPRMWLKLPARFISPLLISSHLHILPVQLRLLVHDWYIYKFTEGILLPYFM
jgi:hypothetical protein